MQSCGLNEVMQIRCSPEFLAPKKRSRNVCCSTFMITVAINNMYLLKIYYILVPGPRDRKGIRPRACCQKVHDLLPKGIKNFCLGEMTQLWWLFVDSFWEILICEGKQPGDGGT